MEFLVPYDDFWKLENSMLTKCLPDDFKELVPVRSPPHKDTKGDNVSFIGNVNACKLTASTKMLFVPRMSLKLQD